MSDDSQSAYAGRWVARIRGKIVAQGGTPEQAMHAAQMSRHKEKPEIIYMPIHFSHSPLLDKVRDALPEQEIYLVGGAVRDMLLNRLSRDLDFAVPAKGISLARRVANSLQADPSYLGAGFMILDDERDTGRVVVTDSDGSRTYLDFASYRGGSTLEADLRDRDFTINAIAYDLRSEALIDPLNGVADLRAKLIRACSKTSFTDDPVRILRGVRQAAAFDFKIDLETRQRMKNAGSRLPNVSPERQRDELFKILDGPKPDASMRALEMLGVFPHMLPELTAMKGAEQSPPHVYDVWEHTLKVLGYLEGILAALETGASADDPFLAAFLAMLGKYREKFAAHLAEPLNTDRAPRAALFFAALYHDVGKPVTKSIDETGRIRFFQHEEKGADAATKRGHAFNLSNDELERIRKILLHHMRLHFFTDQWNEKKQEPTRRAIYRFFRDTGEAGVDLVVLSLADLRGTRDHTLTREYWSAALHVAGIFLENYFEKREETVAPPRLVDGHDLMETLGLEPGRILGQLIEAIREEQAIGNILNRDQAIEFSRTWLAEHGRSEIENRKST